MNAAELPTARPIFVAEIEQLGGAERSLLALARWLHAQGLPHYLLTYRDHCHLAHFADFPLQLIDLKVHGGARAKVAALREHFRARPASSPAPLLSGYQPALHATLAGMHGFHDLMHDTPSLFGDEDTRDWRGKLRIAASNRIIARGLRSGGCTFVNSEFLRSECRRDFGIEAVIQRMGGLAPAANASRDAHRYHPGDTLRLLSISRVQHNKRLDWLLDALAALERSTVPPLTQPLSQLAPWRFDIVGKGDQIDALRAQAQRLGLANRVHLHGFLPDAEVDALYARAHLFLMPARQGYGIPAVEAISRGLPVLLHRESGISDLLLATPWATVLHGGPSETPAGLAEAVAGVLTQHPFKAPPPEVPTETEWAVGHRRPLRLALTTSCRGPSRRRSDFPASAAAPRAGSDSRRSHPAPRAIT